MQMPWKGNFAVNQDQLVKIELHKVVPFCRQFYFFLQYLPMLRMTSVIMSIYQQNLATAVKKNFYCAVFCIFL